MTEPGKGPSAGRIADDVKCYVDMRVASVKLALVEGLSRICGNAVRITVFLFLATLAMMALAAALISWLATVLDSTALAALIVGIVLLLVGLIVLAAKKMFINPMVGMFSEMFFKPRKHEHDYDEEEVK